jgi:hypothetical protein
MPKFKITTNTGHSFTFEASSPIEAQHQFICKALDDFVEDQTKIYGEIVRVSLIENSLDNISRKNK